MANPVGVSTCEVGDVRLTLLPDGYHRCDPVASFLGSTPAHWADHPELLDERGRLVMTMGALLAELPTGERVLIDLGFGPQSLVLADARMEFWGGRLPASLAEVGLGPADIDVVLLSHLHLDHIGWAATATATPVFPRARHVVQRAEWEHWEAEPRGAGPSDAFFGALADRVELLDGEARIAPGLRVVPTPGHTPGHASFLVESGAERAVILGDAIHCPLQISHPEWAFAADANPAAAVAAREHLLRELDEPGTIAVGPHFADAVFGRVLAGEARRQVRFDVAPAAPAQPLAPEAPADAFLLPPLD